MSTILKLNIFKLISLFVFHFFNCLIYDVILLSFSHVLILLSTLGMVSVLYSHIRIKQNLNLLKKICRDFNWIKLKHFIENDIRTFSISFEINPNFSKLFLSFISTNMPTNAFIVMMIADGQVKGWTLLYVSSFAASQFSCILIMHCVFAFNTKNLHKSAKFLGNIMVLNQHRVGQFRSRLQLSLTFMRLSVTNKYGVQYGPFSLVTLAAFFKSVLLYFEMMMYFYKLINNF